MCRAGSGAGDGRPQVARRVLLSALTRTGPLIARRRHAAQTSPPTPAGAPAEVKLYDTLIALNAARVREGMWEKPDAVVASIMPYVRQAVVIDVSAVAEYYLQTSDQEEWTIGEDFPNIAPPWPVAWWEWTIPPLLNSEGKITRNPTAGWKFAALIISEEIEATPPISPQLLAFSLAQLGAGKRPEHVLQLRDIGMDGLWGMLSSVEREKLTKDAERANQERAERLHSGDSMGWACEAYVFSQPLGDRFPSLVAMVRFPVQRDGQPVFLDDGGLVWETAVTREELENNHLHGGSVWMHVPLLATSFSHCKNVGLVFHEPPPKLARAQTKRRGGPNTSYYTLDIQPMRQVLSSEGGQDAHGSAQRALHICRGHFKDYRERGLFGKVHGVFWWDMAVRGNADAGVVMKDYRIGERS